MADPAGAEAAGPTMIELGWDVTGLLRAMATMAVVPVVVAGLSGNGAVISLAVPAALWLVIAGPRPERESLSAALTVDLVRCVEGDTATVRLTASIPGTTIEAVWGANEFFEVIDLDDAGRAEGRWTWTVRAERWGRHRPRVTIRVVADGGGWQATTTVRTPVILVEPIDEPLGQTLRGLVSRPSYGQRAVRAPGPGTEFLDVRTWTPGQPLRRVHWPATVRTGEWHVAGFAANRNQDVVLVVDASTVEGAVESAAYDRAVRATSGLARVHLACGDRVGLVLAGPMVRWQRFGTGRRQLIRIIDTVVDIRHQTGLIKPSIERLPPGALTPGALVVFVSALLDDDIVGLIAAIRQRGHPTVVIDVLDRSPSMVGPPPDHQRAVRLWHLERSAARFELAGRGVLVIEWPAGDPLEGPLAGAARVPLSAATGTSR